MTAPRLVSLSASPHEPSKTTALLDAITVEFSAQIGAPDSRILISEIWPDLARAKSRNDATAPLEEALTAVEQSDVLVVTTPMYRATYTGMFKHFFDLIGQDALAGKPVFLAAIGGNLSHSLSIDHQLRPLFGFFRAAALPAGVFAQNSDFNEYSPSGDLRTRISSAVEQAVPIIRSIEPKRTPWT